MAQLESARNVDARFRMLADSIPQIVWITDANGNVEFMNRHWLEYTGTSALPTNAADVSKQFVHPDDQLATMEAWEKAARAGSTFHVEHRILSGSGHYRWFMVRAEPYFDPESGVTLRWFGTSTDVHDARMTMSALTKSEARYRNLFNSIDEGFCIVEVLFDDVGKAIDYRFCEVNATFVQQTGLVNAEGKRMRDLAPAHEEHWFEIYGEVVRTGEAVRFENEAKALGRWYDVYAFPADGEKSDRVAILFKDITERKRQDREMQQAARSKDEFLAMLAHELRNPLAPIGAAAELLKLGTLDGAGVRKTSEVIVRQVRHMTGLVDDLLDVSRVTSGLIRLETALLDIKRVVGDAVEQVRPLIEARSHHIAVHLPPASACVAGDANRLVQVLANLLNNAAKYTPAGGRIELRIDVTEAEVQITVRDNGIGIAPEFLSGVFDMFSQAQRTADRAQGGLGLGLALVRSLVELHGGSVAAHSGGLGQGSDFIVRLPRVQSAEAPPAATVSSVTGSARPLNLMIVDDNEDAASMLAMLLQVAGHRVLVEHDARFVLARARIERPDVLLLDIGLPHIDGYELARQLRAHPDIASSVLIAVTGYGQEHDRQKSADAGFDRHFVKPVDMHELTQLLAQVGTRGHPVGAQ